MHQMGFETHSLNMCKGEQVSVELKLIGVWHDL